ncbi:MAG TPA: response regulator, partial [Caldilineaceae bacterium]|nr:response regulator [Caldilineaceae bacterium]
MIQQDYSITGSLLAKKSPLKEKTIRVVTIDDSALIRLTLNRYLNQFADIEVVGQANNGQEMLTLVEELRPDVVVLDVEMPVMNGLEALGRLMCVRPLPVIMLSNLTWSGAEVTLQALELGAVDFVVKPQPGVTMAETVDILVQKIRHVAQARVTFRHREVEESAEKRNKIQDGGNNAFFLPKRIAPLQATDTLLAVASSTGGPSALTDFLAAIPPGLPIAGVIVQHMPVGFTTILGQRLNRNSSYKILEAAQGSRLMRGQFL